VPGKNLDDRDCGLFEIETSHISGGGGGGIPRKFALRMVGVSTQVRSKCYPLYIYSLTTIAACPVTFMFL